MVRVLNKWEDYGKKRIHYRLAHNCKRCRRYYQQERVYSMSTLSRRFGVWLSTTCPLCFTVSEAVHAEPPLWDVRLFDDLPHAKVGKITWLLNS
jgi:hypothetical protein